MTLLFEPDDLPVTFEIQARGLWAASGKRTTETRERDPDDFYATNDSRPVRALVAAEKTRIPNKIHAACAGDGAMVRDLEALGYEVFKSDLVDRGCGAVIKDFYDFDVAPAKAQIENPPFQECNYSSAKAQWIWHALQNLKYDYLALLLPDTWCNAAGLKTLFETYPISRVYQLTFRVDFTGKGAPPSNLRWFVWDQKSDDFQQLFFLHNPDKGAT